MAVIERKLEFCSEFIFLKQQLIRFDDRPYLPAVYQTVNRNLVLRCSRQVEKSTFLVNTILYEACARPGVQILLVCPRLEQARILSRDRLQSTIEQSPLIRRTLLGMRGRQPSVMNMRFKNGSRLFIRSAFNSADGIRGVSADLLLVDEFQDIAAGDLPVLQETLSHAINGGCTILVGTPKSIDNHLEGVFSRSTANEWQIRCNQCQKTVILDERCLGPNSVICPGCQNQLDPRHGTWVPRNPAAQWGEGYWINHFMVPWLKYQHILNRQQNYDLVRFKNEVLGLPTSTGDQIVTRVELEACCSDIPFANSFADVPLIAREHLVAGIDWGGGGTSRTVLVIGYMRSDYSFQICRFERFNSQDDPVYVLQQLANRCNEFQVQWIAADGGGNGHVQNRLLWDRLASKPNLYGIHYSATDHEPRRDGILTQWTVNRSATIGALFTRIKRQQIRFPRVGDSGTYLDEFACEIAEYDDINRTTRYSHPETKQDDALHATNYALLLAIKLFQAVRDSED